MATPSFHSQIRERLVRDLQRPAADEAAQLKNGLRLLGKWRSQLVQNTLIQREGTRVLQGPFAGMAFLARSAEGCHVPKLLGCYEQPLHAAIEAAIAANYATVVNVGCAEGYYTVGMARRMPHARFLAFDIDENAQATCRQLAEQNGVADRVQIGARFDPAGFAALPPGRTLVLCDIEGGEGELLDPALAPDLARMDLIVESHDCLSPGMTARLVERFRPTHDIAMIPDDGLRRLDPLPRWFSELDHMDQLLATWEWRSGPTPWLVMKARSAPAA